MTEKIYSVSREENEGFLNLEGTDYSGCHYRVGFKVNRPVSITGFQFFGPSTEEFANYQIEFSLQRLVEDWFGLPKFFQWLWPWGPYYKIDELREPFKLEIINVPRHGLIKVNFPKPVYVEEHKWTDVLFEIKGPATDRLRQIAERDTIVTEDGSEVTFEFLTSGSHQLSKIYFFTE